jgi:hypothetical protein
MYNTHFNCTYQDEENVSDVDLDLAEDKYREDFLQTFGVSDYCDDTVNAVIQDLYKKIKDDEKMMILLKKMSTTFMVEDPEIGLIIAFSYDYFYLTHPCMCDLLETGTISQENFDSLKLKVENNIKQRL